MAEFTVKNGKIYDPDGRQFIARGPNCYALRDRISWAQIKGLWPATSLVRLPTGLSPAAEFDSFVNAASADKCVTMIEFHPWPLEMVHTGGRLTEIANWYASVAERFKDNPYVWFNTPNEPQSQDGASIAAEHRKIYDAIRGTGSRAIILLEAGTGGGNPGSVGAGFLPAATYRDMVNVGIDLHFYGWMSGESTDVNKVRNTLLGGAGTRTGILACKAMVSGDGNMPVVVGEFGVSIREDRRDYNWRQDVDAVMNWAVQQGHTSGWAAWCWNADPQNNLQSGGRARTDWGDVMNAGASATKAFADAQPGLGNVVPPPPPLPTGPESADGTAVAGVGPTIINATGEVFAITSGGRVSVNGTDDTSTGNVTKMVYSNHRVYQGNLAGGWWSEARASESWREGAPPGVNPPPPVPVVPGPISVRVDGATELLAQIRAALAALR